MRPPPPAAEGDHRVLVAMPEHFRRPLLASVGVVGFSVVVVIAFDTPAHAAAIAAQLDGGTLRLDENRHVPSADGPAR